MAEKKTKLNYSNKDILERVKKQRSDFSIEEEQRKIMDDLGINYDGHTPDEYESLIDAYVESGANEVNKEELKNISLLPKRKAITLQEALDDNGNIKSDVAKDFDNLFIAPLSGRNERGEMFIDIDGVRHYYSESGIDLYTNNENVVPSFHLRKPNLRPRYKDSGASTSGSIRG